MKILKSILLGFLLVISIGIANAVSINQESQEIIEGDSLNFNADGQDIVYYEWDFNGVIPEKTVNGRYIFYTSTVHDGKFGDTEQEALANADEFCNNALRNAGIPGTCITILSTVNIDAIDRIPEADGFYNINGQKVADAKLSSLGVVGLAGSYRLKDIIVNEFGEAIKDSGVWTGSIGSLTRAGSGGYIGMYTCSSWTSNFDCFAGPDCDTKLHHGNIGAIGYTELPKPWKHLTYGLSCANIYHIYGVQADENPIRLYEGTKIRMKKIGDVKFDIPGEYTIDLKGYKEDDSYEESSIVITVLENQAPVLTVENQEFNENQKVIFPVIAEDFENEVLTFSVETNIEGYEFNTETDSCIGQEDIDIIVDYYYGSSARYDERIDFNNDGKINLGDIGIIVNKFDKCKGDENYNPEYDLSNKIRIFSWQTNYFDAGEYTSTFTVVDERGKSSEETITISVNDVNRLPTKPILISPENNAENVELDAELSWEESTDEDGDSITYKVYFGTTPELVSTQTTTIFDPELDYETTYYWKIIVSDGKDSVESDLYTFTIRPENLAPIANAGPDKTGTDLTSITLSSESYDLDGTIVSYEWKENEDILSTEQSFTRNYSIGTHEILLTVTDDKGKISTDTVIVTISESPKIIIKDLDVKIDDKTDSNVLNGETVSKDIKPGSTITLKLNIENTYTEDIEIEDIEVKATLLAIDDGEDIEEELSEFDLKKGKDKKVSIKLDIPYKVEEGIYDLDIHVEGNDEGRTHIVDWIIKLNVEKDKHKVIIYKADLGSNTLGCVRTTNLNLEVLNIGQEEEDNIKVVVLSKELGIDFVKEGIELSEEPFDDESTYEKTIRIHLSDDFEQGTYPILIEVYRDNKLEDSEELSLIVEECEVVEKEEKKGIEITKIPIKKILEEVKKADVGLIAALSVGIVVVLVLIILALVLGFRKR